MDIKFFADEHVPLERLPFLQSQDLSSTLLNNPAQKFRPFSCSTCQHQLHKRMKSDWNTPQEAFSESIYASLCLADISGFTRLSARLSADELKFHINVIRRNHGDVVKFLGDAVLILWPTSKFSSEEVQAAATTMACLCALQLLKDCGSYDSGEGEHKVELRLHCGVVCGFVHTMCMGVSDRWEYIVSGTPLLSLGDAISEANSGECCLSKDAYDKISEHFEAIEMPKGSYRLTGNLKPLSFIATRLIDEMKQQNQQPPLSTTFRPHRRSIFSANNPRSNIDFNEKPLSAISQSNSTLNQGRTSGYFSPGRRLTNIIFSSVNSYDENLQRETVTTSSKPAHRESPKSTRESTLSISTNLLSSTYAQFGISSESPAPTVTSNSDVSNSRSESRKNSNSYHESDESSLRAGLRASSKHQGVGPSPSRKSLSTSISAVDSFGLIRNILTDERFQIVRNFLHGFLLVNAEDENEIFQDISFGLILRTFVHNAARSAIDSGTDGYLPELRNVTTMFVEILDMDDDLCNGQLERPQAALAAMLDILTNFEGSFRQFVMDDKGCVMIAAFGLPDSSHEDNCVRAVEVAVALRPRFKKLGLKCRIGISEGKVYCGVVGCITDRCEYAMMGCSVNLAARLMGKCQVNEILVSDTVYRAASATFTFLELDKVEAKGFKKPVGVFRPIERSVEYSDMGSDEFIGRTAELKVFSAALNRVLGLSVDSGASTLMLASGLVQRKNNNSKPQTLIVQGEAGVGKSRLVAELLKMVKERSSSFFVMSAKGSEAHIHSPNHVTCQLLEQLFELKLSKKLNRESSVISVVRNRQDKSKVALDKHYIPKEDKDHEQSICSMITAWIQTQTDKDAVLEEVFISAMKDSAWHDVSISEKVRRRDQSFVGGISAIGQSKERTTVLPNREHLGSAKMNTVSQARNLFGYGQQARDRDLDFDPNVSHAESKGRADGYRVDNGEESKAKNARCRSSNIFPAHDERRSSRDISGMIATSLRLVTRYSINEGQAPVSLPSSQRRLSIPNTTSAPLKLTDLVPLLSDILSYSFPDNEITSSLKPSDRKVITNAFLLRLLLLAVNSGLTLMMVDNLQWIDTQSLQVLDKLILNMKQGMFVGIQRTQGNEVDNGQSGVLTIAEQMRRCSVMSSLIGKCTIVTVNPMSSSELKIMLSKTLGKGLLMLHPELLSPLNINKMFARAGGSPFHARALADQMKAAVLSKNFTGVDNLPAGAHNIVVARFDQLSNAEQVVLRTAAIIGTKFHEDLLGYTLRNLHHESFAADLPVLLQTLINHHMIAIDEASSRHSKSYSFADRSVQETIYNLMISNVREHVHGIVGHYLEECLADDLSRFDEVVNHYLLSNNVEKKMHYLKYAVRNAERIHDHIDMLNKYNLIIQLTTGYETAQLRPNLCRKVLPAELPPPEPLRAPRGSRLSFTSVHTPGDDGDSDHLAHFKTAHVARWIDFHDVVKKFRLSPTLDPKVARSVGPHDVTLWLGHMGLTLRMLGNLPSCNNLIQLGLHHDNIYTPSPTKSYSILPLTFRSFVRSIVSYPFVPTISSANSLVLFQKMLHMKAALLAVRGHAYEASETLRTAKYLFLKHDYEKFKSKKKTDKSSSKPSFQDILKQDRSDQQLQKLFNRGKYLRLIPLMATMSYAKVADRITKFMAEIDADDDPITPFCKAVISSGLGEFLLAFTYLDATIDLSLVLFDRHLHHSAVIYKAWLMFLTGRSLEAREAVNEVIQTCISNTSFIWYATTVYSCIHIWAIELKILLDGAQLDFEAAETEWRNLQLALQKDRWRFGPTTSAMVAYNLVRDGKFDEAEPHATYSCRKLGERYQSSIIVGTILFCAVYSAMDIFEHRKIGDGKEDYFYRYKATAAGRALLQAMKRLELMAASFPCLILLHDAIQCRKTRIFPGFQAMQCLNTVEKHTNAFPEFVFGTAMAHLEKSKLCRMLGLSSKSNHASKQLFRQMGFIPLDFSTVSSHSAPTPIGSRGSRQIGIIESLPFVTRGSPASDLPGGPRSEVSAVSEDLCKPIETPSRCKSTCMIPAIAEGNVDEENEVLNV